MMGIYVSVPIACFRRGHAREYWETHPVPPPATCYGFLLSLAGETDRDRHIGCRIVPVLIGMPPRSVVLRTLWRVKNRQNPPGAGDNKTPGQQELLTQVELVIWLESRDERAAADRLEERVEQAVSAPGSIDRFGGLSLGESTHLVNEVWRWRGDTERRNRVREAEGTAFLLHERGTVTLPVWVDHVGSAGTRYVTGNLVTGPLVAPPTEQMPKIEPLATLTD
jgi:CRISPR-associated protein Cas5t